MATIDKNNSPTTKEVETFLSTIDFKLPEGFIEFMKDANGADISTDKNYLLLWPLTDMIQLNKEYNVDEYAPNFFLIGSDGGDTAYAIEKATGHIFEMPFIGMSNEDAVFKCEKFTDLVESL
jgi:hypothetical protein